MLNYRRLKRSHRLIEKLIRIRLRRENQPQTLNNVYLGVSKFFENEICSEIKSIEDVKDFIVTLDLDSFDFYTNKKVGCAKARNLRKMLSSPYWTENLEKLKSLINVGRYTSCSCHVQNCYMPTLKEVKL